MSLDTHRSFFQVMSLDTHHFFRVRIEAHNHCYPKGDWSKHSLYMIWFESILTYDHVYAFSIACLMSRFFFLIAACGLTVAWSVGRLSLLLRLPTGNAQRVPNAEKKMMTGRNRQWRRVYSKNNDIVKRTCSRHILIPSYNIGGCASGRVDEGTGSVMCWWTFLKFSRMARQAQTTAGTELLTVRKPSPQLRGYIQCMLIGCCIVLLTFFLCFAIINKQMNVQHELRGWSTHEALDWKISSCLENNFKKNREANEKLR